MTDQNSFMETINSVKDIITTAENQMSDKEILAYFEDMNLTLEQKQLVLEYLLNPENYQENDATNEVQTEENEPGNAEDKIDVFQIYLDELSLLPQYSEQEVATFYKKLLQGDESAIEPVSTHWLSKVIAIAKNYIEPKVLVDDLVQEGNVALFMKLQELCGSMEKEDVEELLTNAVEQGIAAYVMELRDARESESSLVGKISLINAAEKILAEENGTVPTLKELAEYTKLSEEELAELRDLVDAANNRDE